MDLRLPTHTRSTIQRGVPTETKRRFVGRFYVRRTATNTKGDIAHSSGWCPQKRSGGKESYYARLPVYDEGGTLFWEQDVGSKTYRRQTKICKSCPEIGDLAWRERGACFNDSKANDLLFDPHHFQEAIDEYCSVCPVVQECFDFGAAAPSKNMGTVWGGVYFPVADTVRVKVINARRAELEGVRS